VQLYVHLKKWTLKFKLLYLLNHISYFNKICRICCLNTYIQSLKVWLKWVLRRLKYRIFSRGLFFYWHTLYMSSQKAPNRVGADPVRNTYTRLCWFFFLPGICYTKRFFDQNVFYFCTWHHKLGGIMLHACFYAEIFTVKEIHKNCCTPDPIGGAYSSPPDSLAVFREPTSTGRGGEGRAPIEIIPPKKPKS